MNKQDFDPGDQRFQDRSRQTLDQCLADMDAATVSRLNRIRHAALTETRTFSWRSWALASGLVTASAVVLAMISVAMTGALHQPSLPVSVDTSLADLELLASDENLEMLEELEFYAWLQTELDG